MTKEQKKEQDFESYLVCEEAVVLQAYWKVVRPLGEGMEVAAFHLKLWIIHQKFIFIALDKRGYPRYQLNIGFFFFQPKFFIFSYFSLKTYLWVLIRSASLRDF